MYNTFNESFEHYYTIESVAALVQMYVIDERFKVNIDKFGDGLSEFLSRAMQRFADRRLESGLE